MPKIRQYSPQVRESGPTQTGGNDPRSFGAASAQALGGLGQSIAQVGQAVGNHLENKNVSEVTTHMSRANADLALDLQQTIRNAEPGDPKPFEEFQKRMDDRLFSIQGEAKYRAAKNFFNEASVRVKGQLNKTAEAGEAHLAGVKAVQDYQDVLNTSTSATSASPESHDVQADLVKAKIQTLVDSGSLPPAKATELWQEAREDLAFSAIRGWAKLDVNYAREQMKSGKYDSVFSAQAEKQLNAEIDQIERANEVEETRRRQEQRRLKQERIEGRMDEHLKGIFTNNTTVNDILDDSTLDFASRNQLINIAKRHNSTQGRLQTDAALANNLFDRIHLPEGDPNKITSVAQLNPHFADGLDKSTFNFLRNELQDEQNLSNRAEWPRIKQFLDGAKGQLRKIKALNIADPQGDQRFLEFRMQFTQEYKRRIEAGQSPEEILSPNSKNYIGQMLNEFSATPQEVMRLKSRSLKTRGLPTPDLPQANEKVEKRKPGENIEQYNKRLRGG